MEIIIFQQMLNFNEILNWTLNSYQTWRFREQKKKIFLHFDDRLFLSRIRDKSKKISIVMALHEHSEKNVEIQFKIYKAVFDLSH